MSVERCIEILERVLDMSVLQRRYLAEERPQEFLSCGVERERLFTELKNCGQKEFRNEAAKNLAEKILANDNQLASDISSVMHEISTRLENIKKSTKAIKAYTGK